MPTTTMNTQPNTFANVTKNVKPNFPNKNQAIIINTTQEISIEEYVYKIGDIVCPINNTYVSKISHNRLCTFLSNRQLVDKIIDENNTIIVGDQEVQIRRYINPATRIVISNVCPTIPHSIIVDALQETSLTNNFSTRRTGERRI